VAEALGQVARVLAIVLFLLAVAGQFASQLALWHLIDKIQGLSKGLGGDPPRAGFWTDMEPKFWDYVRKQCQKPGTEELRELVRKADVLLMMRAVTLVAAIAGCVVAVVLHWH